MDLSLILTILGSAGMVAAGVGYGLSSFRKGKVQADLDVLSIANAQIDLLKESVASLRDGVGTLTASLTAAELKLADALRELAYLKGIASGQEMAPALKSYLADQFSALHKLDEQLQELSHLVDRRNAQIDLLEAELGKRPTRDELIESVEKLRAQVAGLGHTPANGPTSPTP